MASTPRLRIPRSASPWPSNTWLRLQGPRALSSLASSSTGSEELTLQAAWSQEFFTAPTHSGALANADQDAVEQTESFSTQDIDWTTVAENLNDWIEKIELDVLG